MTKEEIIKQEYLNILTDISGYDKYSLIVSIVQVLQSWKEELDERLTPLYLSFFETNEEYIREYECSGDHIGLSNPSLYDIEVYNFFKLNKNELIEGVKSFASKVCMGNLNNISAMIICGYFMQIGSENNNFNNELQTIQKKYYASNPYTITLEYENDMELYKRNFDFQKMSILELDCLKYVFIQKKIEIFSKESNGHKYIMQFGDLEEMQLLEEETNIQYTIKNRYDNLLRELNEELTKRANLTKPKQIKKILLKKT